MLIRVGLGNASYAHILSKREAVSADSGIEELNFEGAIGDWAGLPDQLVQAPILHAAPSFGVRVGAVVRARGSAVEPDAEADRVAW
jgi:hypothetical protein